MTQLHKLFHRETRKNKLSKHKIGKIAPRHPVWNETGRGGLRSSFSNEDKRPRLRSGTRSPTSFHGSWPSLASESTSECARKHGKINDTPDTDGGEGRGEGGESGVSLRAATAAAAAAKEETPTAGIALLLFTLPRVLCLTQNCIACQSSRPGKRHLAPLPPLLSLFLAKEPYPRWRILPRVARRTNDFVTSCSRLLYLYFSARRRAEFEFSPSSVSTFSIVVEIGIGNEILMNQPFDLSPFLLPFR